MLKNDGWNIKEFGLEAEGKSTLEEVVQDTDIVLGPIPFSKEEGYLHMPFKKEKMEIDKFFKAISGKKLYVGSISEKWNQEASKYQIEVVDLMEQEELAIFNTIATAEGAIQLAMENTECVIQDCKVLILGFGRVGKMVANKFSKMGAVVYVAARKKEQLAWIQAEGYVPILFEERGNRISEMDIICNTIPTIVLYENHLKKIRKESILIELASAPGGIEKDIEKKLKINYILAQGLPGKVAPKTTAEFIKQTLYDQIK